MGKHEAQRSVRGHSRGHNLRRPQARPSGAPRGGSTPERGGKTPFSHRPRPNALATHARVRPPPPRPPQTHTHVGGEGGHTRTLAWPESVPPCHSNTVGGRPRRGGPCFPQPREGKQRHASLTVSTPPREPLTGRTTAAAGTPRSTLGEGNDTTARPRAPEGRPGALQGHHRGSNEARSRTGRGARRSGGTAPPHQRGEDRPRGQHAEEAKRERLLRPRTTAPPPTP